jgi:DnaJ-class molecular chaperone
VDLYAILGIDRLATSDEVKAAFRAKAKASHPDRGGDRGEFESVKHAYMVLSVSRKRAQYDQDGTVNDDKIDDPRKEAIEFIESMVANLVAQIENSDHEPTFHLDLIGSMLKTAEQNISNAEALIAKQTRSVERLKKFSARFKAKGDHKNYISHIIDFKIRGVQTAIAANEHSLGRFRLVVDILKEHEFQADPRPAVTQVNPYCDVRSRTAAISRTR